MLKSLLFVLSLISFNAYAVDYSDLFVGKTTKADLHAMLKEGSCTWYIEMDRANLPIEHHRIEGSCFVSPVRKKDIVDIVFDDNNLIKRKGILFFDDASSSFKSTKYSMTVKYGEPYKFNVMGIPGYQWNFDDYLITLVRSKNSAALFESYAETSKKYGNTEQKNKQPSEADLQKWRRNVNAYNARITKESIEVANLSPAERDFLEHRRKQILASGMTDDQLIAMSQSCSGLTESDRKFCIYLKSYYQKRAVDRAVGSNRDQHTDPVN